MSKFKVGDKVRCVDSGCEDNLTEGAVYTVRYVNTNYVAVDGIGYVLAESRFELIQLEKTPLDIVKEMYEDAWRNGDSKLATYYEVLVEAFGVDVSVKAENYIFTYMPKKQG